MVPKAFSQWFLPLLSILLLPAILAGRETPSPYEILRQHYEAIGGLERLQKQRSSFSSGKIRYDGLSGTFRHWDKRPLQYRQEEDYGIITQVEGDDGKQSWYFDTNGQVLLLKDKESITRRQLRFLLDQYEHLNPQSPYFTISYGGATEVDGSACHRIIITNSLNSDRYQFFFSRENLVLQRSIVTQPDVEVTTDFGDYRWANQILTAFYAKTLYMPWQKEEETWTKEYRVDIDMEDSRFAVPEPRAGYHFIDGGKKVAVPFQLIEDLIYLPVTIGKDSRYWVLDSGATMSVIDEDYAREIGLSPQGSINGYGFGELFTLGFTTIPSYRVGKIAFEAQKTYVAKDLRRNSYEPEIVGILGYDFLSRFVVEIDYHQHMVTFHAPESFNYQGDGVRFSAPLKYRTFTLPVTLDQKLSSRWTVDLGSYRSSVHYQFAEANGLLHRPGVETVSQGMSGLSWETSVQFNCLQIGPFLLDHQIVTIPTSKGQGAAALGEVGGNLGNSTLRNFHLFLDYPQQEIILEKGQYFNARLPRDQSGLLIGRSEHHQPMVSFIAADTPAARSGLESGDIIVAVNGEKIGAGSPVMPLRKQLRTEPVGTVMHYTVKRGEQTLTEDLTLQDLYPAPAGKSCRQAKGE